jgi:DeoR family fructose operon transcriptional repressor
VDTDSSGCEKLLFAEERRRRIVELVNSRRKIVIPELVRHFGVSASTIRNDLRDLQDEGKITRTHGGAIINSKSGYEPLPFSKETQMLPAKKMIARAAAAFVEDGDIIAVGTGSTTYEFIKCLEPDKNLTVILNDIYFAAYLERMENINVVLLGGALRRQFHYLQMPAGNNYLSGVNIDKAFISCNGIHVRRGVTTPDPSLAYDLGQIIGASAEVYVLSDSSKFGSVSFARIIDIADVNAIITDSHVDGEDVVEMKRAGVDILVAEKIGT